MHYSRQDEMIVAKKRRKDEFMEKFEKACRFFDAENHAASKKINNILKFY